jgi:osmoprotectant transport system substrate-binding protein
VEPRPDTATITVGSFDFAESELLAALYGGALERRGLPVEYRLGLGPREFVQPALRGGLVDVVVEYAGTATQFLRVTSEPVRADPAATHTALARAAGAAGAVATAAAPAQDTNAFVVTRATATRHRLRTIGDLAPVARGLVFGGPVECATRPLCLPGVRRTYGVRFGEVAALDVGGPLTLRALETGDIDVGLLFSTDPALRRPDLVVLRDDRELQPAENVTPLVRSAVVERYGARVIEALDAVSRRLDTDTLRALNATAAGDPGGVRRVARAWLTREAVA